MWHARQKEMLIISLVISDDPDGKRIVDDKRQQQYNACSSRRRLKLRSIESAAMLIKEYRIPVPMTVDEYRIAQLYMIVVSVRTARSPVVFNRSPLATTFVLGIDEVTHLGEAHCCMRPLRSTLEI